MISKTQSASYSLFDITPKGNSGSITVIIDKPDNTATLLFCYRKELVELVRAIPGRRWDPVGRAWVIPLHPDTRNYLTDLFSPITCCKFYVPGTTHGDAPPSQPSFTLSTISEVPESFTDLLIKKRYSKSTIKNYSSQIVNCITTVANQSSN